MIDLCSVPLKSMLHMRGGAAASWRSFSAPAQKKPWADSKTPGHQPRTSLDTVMARKRERTSHCGYRAVGLTVAA
jgi:hypothetical protein